MINTFPEEVVLRDDHVSVLVELTFQDVDFPVFGGEDEQVLVPQEFSKDLIDILRGFVWDLWP